MAQMTQRRRGVRSTLIEGERYLPATSPLPALEPTAVMISAVLPRMTRETLPKGEFLCQYCSAKCCRYFALPIDKPESFDEFENIRWFMLHGRVGLFVEADVWYLMVFNDCRHLQPDNLCGIYETRPTICRTYSTDNCEYDDDGLYDLYFETPEQMWEYTQAMLPAKQPRKFSTAALVPSDVKLPIVTTN
jgi:Fe-S-cluster containining protein